MAQLYVDEDVAHLAGDLRGLGHDVISVVEDESRRSKTDAWHFREAVSGGRVLITWNRRDFQYIHRLWTTLETLRQVGQRHPGVLTADAVRDYRREDWIPTVHDKLSSPDPLAGRLWVWVSSENRWVEDRTQPEED